VNGYMFMDGVRERKCMDDLTSDR